MAQEPRRDQPVRLPNPSAQPFVVALKTARFYAVLLYWVTAVCVLAHATTFVLTEWIGLYDLPAESLPASPAPVPAASPAGVHPEPKLSPEASPAPPANEGAAAPASPTSPAEAGFVAREGGWMDLFEGTAQAAPASSGGDEATFFGVPSGAKKKSSAASATPTYDTSPATAAPDAATEGKVTADVDLRPIKQTVAPGAKALHYRTVTANVLKPARIVGRLASMLLAMTIFLYLQITLLGRLAGIRQLTNALFLMLLFLATALPWENVFEGLQVSSLFDFDQRGGLLDAHAARLLAGEIGAWTQVQYIGRFFAMPIASLVLLAWSGIQFAAGYGDSVLANE